MSILTHSPAIVRDGLVLCLDAGAVRSYAGNLVTNGAFDADSDWTKGTNWTIGSGAASHTASSSSDLTQAVSELVEGKSYVCTYTISSYSAGDVRLVLGGTNGTYRGVTGGAQTWRETLTCGSTDSNVKFYGHTAFVGSIDNVIVQEATWSDLSGNFNNGTLVNEPVFSAESGAGGTKSFDFDGSSDYIDCGTGFNHTSNLTCEMWAKIDTGSCVMFAQWHNASNKRKWFIGVNSTNVWFYIDSAGSGTFTSVDGGAYPTDGEWHHYALVYTPSSSLVAYVDGESVGSDTSSVAASIYSSTDVNIYIGRSEAGEYWDGKIAIARMYTKSLTATEIQQNYRTHKGRFGR